MKWNTFFYSLSILAHIFFPTISVLFFELHDFWVLCDEFLNILLNFFNEPIMICDIRWHLLRTQLPGIEILLPSYFFRHIFGPLLTAVTVKLVLGFVQWRSLVFKHGGFCASSCPIKCFLITHWALFNILYIWSLRSAMF